MLPASYRPAVLLRPGGVWKYLAGSICVVCGVSCCSMLYLFVFVHGGGFPGLWWVGGHSFVDGVSPDGLLVWGDSAN